MDISVIIPTYNRRDTILRSVESVLCQTYPVQEVIIADDCSSDDTEEVVKRLQDARIRYCRLPRNRGAGGARNFGAAQARFDWIAFHDSDDVWRNEKIEKQMCYYERHPDCDLIYCAYELRLSADQAVVVPDAAGSGRLNLEGDMFRGLLLQNSIGAPTVLMKKKLFEEIGGFDETMSSLEDWDFALKAAKACRIGFVPEVLMDAANSEGGISSDENAYFQSRCHMIRRYLPDYLETGLLDIAVRDILGRAEKRNLLKQVSRMLMQCLEDGQADVRRQSESV